VSPIVTVSCPACRSLVTVESTAGANQPLICQKCGEVVPVPMPTAEPDVYAAELVEPVCNSATAPTATRSSVPWWGYAVAMLVLMGTVGGLVFLYFQKTAPRHNDTTTKDQATSQAGSGPTDTALHPPDHPENQANPKKSPGLPAPPSLPPSPKLPPLPEEVARAVLADKREILPGTWHTELPYPITIVYEADGKVTLTVTPPNRATQQFQGHWRLVEAINPRTVVIEWEDPTQRRQRMEVVFEWDGDIQHPVWRQPRLIPKFSKKK
jgi:type IV secretory pathway VirB10-like protein